MDDKAFPPIKVLIQVVSIWIASNIGYYMLLPLFGLEVDYNLSPTWIALYYFFWIILILNIFWPVYSGWRPVERSFPTALSMLLFLSGLFLFAYYALPMLPSVVWTETWDPPELMLANSWYFIPKFAEILLQQLLIAALVLDFHARKFSVKEISFWCMILFGIGHVLLALNGSPLLYVARFTVSALIFGYVFPILIIRVPNGFLYSYMLHWLYYVVTIIMAHTISPYAS